MAPEFNNGFLTALMLSYGHRYHPKTKDRDLRLEGAADHLLDIEMPDGLDEDLKKRVLELKGKVMALRFKDLPSEEVDEIFDEIVEIMKELDRRLFGLAVTVNHP
jgi:hypothetical protein